MALDCERVRVGRDGKTPAVAWVAVVNNNGNVLLDTFVDPGQAVQDYRTPWSGVREEDLINAPAFAEVQAKVLGLLAGRIVVGHSLHHDLEALDLNQKVPAELIRDTGGYRPLMVKKYWKGKCRLSARKLQELVVEKLDADIQAGEHSPVDDARASLYIYHKYRGSWEAEIKAGKA